MNERKKLAPDVNAAFSLHQAARTVPSDLALRIDGRDYGFAALDALADEARTLIDKHWDGKSAVALVCVPSLHALLFLFACLERGAPLLCVHPRWSSELRQQILEQVAPQFLIEDGELHQRPHASQAPPLPSRTQILIATSGSTSRPKVVLLSKDALLASARASAHNMPWQKGDRWLLSLPFAHIGGLSLVLRCLEARQALVCEALDPNQGDFSAQLDALGITLLSLVPAQLHAWLRSGKSTPKKLRWVLVGGSSCSLELYRAARAKELPVLCTYGLSEMASQVATQCPSDLKCSTGAFQPGLPLRGIELRIDDDGGLHLKGPQLMLGYLGISPEETFKSGWFPTSDRATLTDDGRLSIVGRMDNVIISGGENVSPEWVESVLAPLKGVSDFCIAALPDPKWGQRVVAAVVLERADEEDPFETLLPEWFARAYACLPNYARPKQYLRFDALPRTNAGKLDRLDIQRLVTDQRK